jgi:hypothetical protein
VQKIQRHAYAFTITPQGGIEMSAEQLVAQRFIRFLVENISLEVGKVDTSGRIVKHCEELQQAIATLFADGEISRPAPVRKKGAQ